MVIIKVQIKSEKNAELLALTIVGQSAQSKLDSIKKDLEAVELITGVQCESLFDIQCAENN